MKMTKANQLELTKMLLAIAMDLLKDIANCDKVDYKLSDYGVKILSKYPKLEKYKKEV